MLEAAFRGQEQACQPLKLLFRPPGLLEPAVLVFGLEHPIDFGDQILEVEGFG